MSIVISPREFIDKFLSDNCVAFDSSLKVRCIDRHISLALTLLLFCSVLVSSLTLPHLGRSFKSGSQAQKEFIIMISIFSF